MSLKDPYATLGVEKNATQDEIRMAYRNLAKKHHPDLNPGSKASEAKFKDISLAYEMLGTPENRAKFDRGEYESPEEPPRGREGPFYSRTQTSADGAGGRYSHSFANGFDEDLFSAFGFPPEDEIYQMEIDLGDTVSGVEREIQLPSGKRLRVKIPPGTTEGSRLRFAAQGAPRRHGGEPVDVYIELRIRPDMRFEVSGRDLISRLRLPIGDAVLGGEVKVPTLEGHVLLRVPPHSNSGSRLKLRGKGLYDRMTKKRGDQIVVVELALPDPIDPDFEAAIRQWQANRKQGAHGNR